MKNSMVVKSILNLSNWQWEYLSNALAELESSEVQMKRNLESIEEQRAKIKKQLHNINVIEKALGDWDA